MKPLCYPPAKLIGGKLSFTGVVSVTLNFHPQGRNVNDVTNEGKSSLGVKVQSDAHYSSKR